MALTAPYNPRLRETNIYDDAGNRRRTETTYKSVSGNVPAYVKLPEYIKEYNASASTVYRTTQLKYVHDVSPSAAYVQLATNWDADKWLIGLVVERDLYEGSTGPLKAKSTYSYDDLGEHLVSDSNVPNQEPAYNSISFQWRGNLTQTTRWSVTTPITAVTTKTGYGTSGSVRFLRDAVGAQTNISYTDSFSQGSYFTRAYPTTVTDPDGFVSTRTYDFHTGLVTETQNPASAQGEPGAIFSYTYDIAGRLTRVDNSVNAAYTRYSYHPNYDLVSVFTTVEANYPETYTHTYLDGFGRTIGIEKDHPKPEGQPEGQRSSFQEFVYDSLGRLFRQSNPTEVNPLDLDTAVGDDAQTGFYYTEQTYDWQGRPLITTNQDGTTSQASYTGCGCAGNDVTTMTDEGTLDNGVAKRRQQKIFKDIFGRVVKTQALNWENGSPYSTTITSYNVRDQITTVKEYSGNSTGTEACSSPTCQLTTRDYDGHGRLWKQRRPVETADNVYLYNSDDTLWKATDPRNVTATYSYNNRKLTTDITYDSMPNAVLPSSLPSLPIPSASVTFGYDEAGNRTWMNDAPGRVDYVYDQLSQLKEETRLFDVSAVSRSFTLKYEYNLAGELKQITDPWNAVVNYNRDKAGQETGLTATGYKDVNQWTNRDVNTFASNIKYRAWGGIKQFANGTLSGNSSFAMGYDSRLRLTSFTGGGRTTQHAYYNDGLVKEVTDLHYGSNFLRKYEYDNVGQLKKAHSGGTAQTASSPYSLTYNYDVWGNTTSRTGTHWSNALTAFSTTYTNDRDVNMTFDAAGNVKGYTTSNDPYMHYDAANQLFTQLENSGSGLVTVRENYQDGDGAKVFYKTSTGSTINGSYSLFCNYFLIRSSVLGGKVLAEFKDLTTLAANDPLKYYSKSYVYLKGVQLGFQEQAHKASGDKRVIWTYHNPTVGNYFAEYQLNNSSGQQVNFPAGEMTFDPLGSYVGISQPPQPLDIPAPFTFVSGQYMEPSGKCYADYVETPCTIAQKMLNNGTGQHAPLDPTATVYNPITKKNELALFTTDWDNGFFGFVPTGANYNGNGSWSWAVPRNGRPTLKASGSGLSGEEVSGNLSSIKLTVFFSGIFTGKEKKNQASANALPGLLDCLGLFQGQIQQLHNDNGAFSALGAAPNKDAAEAAQKIVQQFLTDGGNPSQIQIVAHSNGTPTAKYFLDLITRQNSSFRVGSTVLVAPNVGSTSTVESIFSRSDSNLLMQSNRDFALRLARVLTGASQRIGAFQSNVKSTAKFIQTKQRGHGIPSYRKAYCGY